MTIDARHMRHALALAERGLGTTAPNPSVGCVIVDAEGTIVGRGATRRGGRPHAETEALSMAGPRAKGATVYVTLEPCAHQGRTGPCAQALIDAEVSRVVSACEDPDPRVKGQGHALLRAAGLQVVENVLAAEAQRLNAGFIKLTSTGVPLVTLKIASSLDGRAALANGASQWITGVQARNAGHMLRATHDAIMTGIGTVLADDPQLDCRLPGLADRSPVKIVADGKGRTPSTARLLAGGKGGDVVVFTAHASFSLPGAETVFCAAGENARLPVEGMLKTIGARGITRLLVEAGPTLSTSFIQAGAVDRVVWFRSAKFLGGDARAAVGALGLDALDAAPGFRRVAVSQWGDDLMETYAARA